MNKKGFTLVELLGVIVILSIIMLIAIPNVVSTLERSKKDTYIADAKKMVSLIQYEIRKDKISKPGNTAVDIKLSQLATDEINKDPDGYEYDKNKSFVRMQIVNGYVVYQVQLVTSPKNDGKYRGIKLTDYENLDGDKRYETYVSNVSL